MALNPNNPRGPYRKIPIEDRFWRKVKKTETCWLWTGYTNNEGYGCMHSPKGRYVHRISWILHHGDIPDGMDVLHNCDNPPCVNPEHLFLGDQLDNMRDCADKGRNVPCVLLGEENPSAKLTEGLVLEIRRAKGKQRDIAKMYGISQSNVSVIKRRVIWKHA